MLYSLRRNRITLDNIENKRNIFKFDGYISKFSSKLFKIDIQ